MPPSTPGKISLPSPAVIRRGVRWFVLFTVAGVILSLWWKSSANLLEVLTHLNGSAVALLLPLGLLDSLLGGLRYRLFFDGKVLPKISLWDNMRANWANMFMGAATPFQTGGGPAQFYILWRCGAKVSQSVLVSTINFAATLIFFQAASLFAMLALPPGLFGANIVYAVKTAFWVVGTITAAVFFLLLFPRQSAGVISLISGIIPARFRRLHRLKERGLEKLRQGSASFGSDFREILRIKKGTLFLTVITTLALFFNKFLIGYVIARALQQAVDLTTFFGLQILHFFLIYFAPTPGASGIAEVSSVWLMAKVLPVEILLIYTVAWRFFTTYLGALAGSVVLVRETRGGPGKRRPHRVVEGL
ncbi:MAG: flippase-like domain-containing protein [Calditrichae bacterium]|nr:flippase-like domain-containing protein [Calditrichia bacterium]